MSPKDQQIINANKGATPYDLLTKHGLSQGGFNELTAIADEQAANVLKAGTPKLSPNVAAAIPVTTVHQPLPNQGQQVILRGKKGIGNGTLMDRQLAEKQVRKYPNDYEIVG